MLLFSATLIPPLAVSWLYGDGELPHLSITFGAALSAGLLLWLPLSGRSYAIRNRDGFVIVAVMWIAMSVLGALPFVLGLDMSFVDAFFEATSGYTTTGSTVIVGLDGIAPSILFYRQEINWLGGIGVIVLAVALLPMLRIGGMQLYRAETPGPVKDERITPRIAGTARTLCVLYVWMTAACAVSYWLAGMNAFDAVGAQLRNARDGRFLDSRRELRLFQQPRRRGRRRRLHAVGRHQLQRSLHGVAEPAASKRTRESTEVRVFFSSQPPLIAFIATRALRLPASRRARSPHCALLPSRSRPSSRTRALAPTTFPFGLWRCR